MSSSGNKLGTAVVNADGTFEITLNRAYSGIVVLKTYDKDTSNADKPTHLDEATRAPALLSSSTFADGKQIVLVFDELLDTQNLPPTSAFTVTLRQLDLCRPSQHTGRGLQHQCLGRTERVLHCRRRCRCHCHRQQWFSHRGGCHCGTDQSHL